MPATEFNITSAIEIGEATRLDLTYSSAATARDYLFILKNGNTPVYSCRLAADSNDDNITVEAGVKVAVELTDTQTLNYFQTTGMNYELYEKNPSVLGADFAMVLYGTIAAEDTVDPVDSDLRISPVASGYANKEIADIPVSSGLLFVRDSNGVLYYNNGTEWEAVEQKKIIYEAGPATLGPGLGMPAEIYFFNPTVLTDNEKIYTVEVLSWREGQTIVGLAVIYVKRVYDAQTEEYSFVSIAGNNMNAAEEASVMFATNAVMLENSSESVDLKYKITVSEK